MAPDKHKLLKGHRVLPLAREFLDAIDLSIAPQITWPGDVDRDELKQALGVNELVTFTLPIGEVDALSGNGFTYTEPSVLGLVRQVNQIRPEGFWGHLRDDEIGTKYSPPAVRWLAAELAEDGIAWGLGVALTEEAGKHFKSAKAIRAKTGTSIFGWNVTVDEEFNVYGYDLVSIDLASSERVGVPVTSAHPSVRSEMQGESEEMGDTKDKAQETTPAQDTNTEQLLNQVESLRREMSSLRMVQSDLKMAKELLNLGDDDDLVQGIRELQRESENLAGENRELLKTYIEDQLKESVKFEEVRPLVRSLVLSRKPSTKNEVKEAIDTVVGSDEVKTLLEFQREKNGGPELGEDNNHDEKTEGTQNTNTFMEPKPETV